MKRFELSALVAVLFLILTLASGPVPAQANDAAQPTQTLTITSLTPDADSRSVEVVFSAPVDIKALRRAMRILPWASLNWGRSKLKDKTRLTLFGEFAFDQNYVLTLRPKTVINGRHYQPTKTGFHMPDSPPHAALAGTGRVVELSGRQLIHSQLLNTQKLKVETVTVPPLLLAQTLALTGQEDQKATADHSASGWQKALSELDKWSGPLAELAAAGTKWSALAGPIQKAARLFVSSGQKNQPRALSVPLTFRPGKTKGALQLVRLSIPGAANRGAASRPLLYRVTDIGLTVKTWPTGLMVWTTSLQTGLPLAGAELYGLTRTLEVFPLGATDGEGLLKFETADLSGLNLAQPGLISALARDVHAFEFTHLIAVGQDDLTYLALDGRAKLDREEKGKKGKLHIPAKGLGAEPARPPAKAVLFTDRGVYRPGDKVAYKAVVRVLKKLKLTAPSGAKGTLTITSPRGEKVVNRKVSLSEFGTVSGWYQTSPHGETGTYTVALRYGKGADDVARHYFQVQEYRRPRHYVELSFSRLSRPDDSLAKPGPDLELVAIKVQGLYYAGGPVSRGQVRWSVSHAGAEHQVKGFEGYTFGSPGDEMAQVIESGRTVLDEKGRAVIEFPLDYLILSGQAGLKVQAWVVDFDGRTSSAVRVYTQQPELMVGIANHPQEVTAGVGQSLSALVTDKYGKRVYFGSLQAEVLQKGGSYIRKLTEQGDVYWSWEPVWRRVFASQVDLKSGLAGFDFEFAWGGDYRISFSYTDERGRKFSSATDYTVAGDYRWYGYEREDDRYQILGLAADRQVYRPGQKAKVLVDKPQRATAYLCSLERDGVLKAWVIRPDKETRALELEVQPDWAPNVWLNVVAVSPRGRLPVHSGRYDDQAPDFAFGRTKLAVKLDGGPLKVEIGSGNGALKSEPGRTMSLSLQALDDTGRGLPAELAVGVIDESVLALTGMKTPDLDSLLLFDSPLKVATAEERRLLTRQTPYGRAKNLPLSGGDGEAAEAKAARAIGKGAVKIRADFNPVAYFNPAVLTGPDGKARISFKLPDSMTTYRIYVVACDTGSRFASAQRFLTVSKDFYVEAGLPRFLTRGDEFAFPIRAFNSSGLGGRAKVTVEAQGGLKLSLTKSQTELPDSGQAEVMVDGRAEAAGPAKVIARGEFNGKTDAVARRLPVSLGLPLAQRSWFGLYADQAEIKPNLPPGLSGLTADQLAAGGAKARLILAGSPLLRLIPTVKRMMDYPYGCLEQTSSRLMTLIGVWPAAEQGWLPGLEAGKIKADIQSGLDRLLSLQVAGGGFSYWPGRWRPDPLGSAYAGTALAMARRAGFKIHDNSFLHAMKYLAGVARRKGNSDTERAMACYALALGGELTGSTIKPATANWGGQNRSARLLLALAAIEANLIKNPDNVKSLAHDALTKGFLADDKDPYLARYLAPALSLLLADRVLKGGPEADQAALKLIGGQGARGMWSSTSDTGWSVFALARHLAVGRQAEGPVAVKVTKPGGGQVELTIDPKAFRTVELGVEDILALAKGAPISLAVTGEKTGLLAWLAELTWPRTGLDAAGLSRGIKVKRQYVNTDGGDQIRVGDIVEVKVSFDVDKRDRLGYLALDDALPAGLVAINPVLKTEQPSNRDGLSVGEYSGMYWSPDGYYRFVAEHVEMRDQRVLAFRDSLWPGKFRFSYFARAVCAGTFKAPSARLQLMYQPGMEGYSPAVQVTILPAKAAD